MSCVFITANSVQKAWHSAHVWQCLTEGLAGIEGHQGQQAAPRFPRVMAGCVQVVHENAELAGAVADLNAQLAVERERCNCLEVCPWLCSESVSAQTVKTHCASSLPPCKVPRIDNFHCVPCDEAAVHLSKCNSSNELLMHASLLCAAPHIMISQAQEHAHAAEASVVQQLAGMQGHARIYMML